MTKISHIPWGGYDKGFYDSTVSTLQSESENRHQSANQEINKHFREISQEISALNLKIVQETLESQQQTTKAFENRINKLMYDQANLINETKEKFDVVIEEYKNKIDNMHKDVDKLSNGIVLLITIIAEFHFIINLEHLSKVLCKMFLIIF